METKININGREVEITLTPEQVKQIKKASEKITDRIKTFEDACEETGHDPNDPKFQVGTPDEIAYKKLKVIATALNEGKKLDYSNGNQKKWYPWFQYVSGSGFRFYGSGYGYAVAYATGGSRLCFTEKELSDYAGNQFIELYNKLLN